MPGAKLAAFVGSACRSTSTAAAAATATKHVGFIGLGNMGARMAANLMKHGHKLTVFDRNAAAVRVATDNGAVAESSPRAVAAASDVVITMLPSSPHVEEVYCGADGVLSGGAVRPSLLIDASTIDPVTARRVAEKAAGCQLRAGSEGISGASSPVMVDAPVSGGVVGAERATLTFMVGGSSEALDAARPLLLCMGQHVRHCGAVGNGQTWELRLILVKLSHNRSRLQVAKLCNNLVLAVSMAAVCEGLSLGQRLGVDPRTLTTIFNTSSARCWSSDSYNPCPAVMEGVPSSRDYSGGFACHLMMKDLGLAQVAGAEVQSPVPLAEAVTKLYEQMSTSGAREKDFSGLFKYVYKGETA
eukprot:jgi/Chlat1/3673/Chrsp24S00279